MIKKILLISMIASSTNYSLALSLAEVLNRTPKIVDGQNGLRVNDRFVARLAKAQKLMTSEKYDKALEELDALENAYGNNKFALSQIFQTRAYVFAQTDKIKKSIESFKKVVELERLPKAALLNTYYALAQVLASEEKYLEAMPYVQDFLYNKKPARADAFFFYGQILTQLKQSDLALENIEKAISLSKSPNKTWLSFASSLYFEKGDYKKSIDAIKKLIELDTKDKKYWLQLSGVYMAMDNELEALSAIESAHKYGLLTEEKEFIRLARLALYSEIPYKAARYLEKSLKEGKVEENAKNLELLSDAYSYAKQKNEAIAAMRKSVSLSPAPKKLLKLGELQITEEKWSDAITALEKVLASPESKKEDKEKARFSLGISYFRTGKLAMARESFAEAKKSKKFEKLAETWLSYMKEKQPQ